MTFHSLKNINLLHNEHRHMLVANRTAFMIIGIIESAWAPIVPYVKSAFQIDEGTLGLLMLCSGLGSICALPCAGWLVNRLGVKKVVHISGLLMALSLLAISLLVNLWLTAVMLMIFGGCTITIDLAANVNGIAIENRTGRHYCASESKDELARSLPSAADRSLKGNIVAEADRFIAPGKIIIRTVQYGQEHYPELDKEGHYKRTVAHMHEKYADGGYLKLWFPDSPNAARLEALRAIIRNEQELHNRFNAVYDYFTNPNPQLCDCENCRPKYRKVRL